MNRARHRVKRRAWTISHRGPAPGRARRHPNVLCAAWKPSATHGTIRSATRPRAPSRQSPVPPR